MKERRWVAIEVRRAYAWCRKYHTTTHREGMKNREATPPWSARAEFESKARPRPESTSNISKRRPQNICIKVPSPMHAMTEPLPKPLEMKKKTKQDDVYTVTASAVSSIQAI